MSEPITTTRVCVKRKVIFWLGVDEQVVIPARGRNRYVLLDTVVVDLRGYDLTHIFAMGIRCRKDGSFSPHWGKCSESVDLDHAASSAWVKRAHTAVDVGGAP